MTTQEQNMHKEYLPNSYVLFHYRTGLPPTRLHTNSKGPMRVIKGLNSRYTLWQREGLPCVRHEASCF